MKRAIGIGILLSALIVGIFAYRRCGALWEPEAVATSTEAPAVPTPPPETAPPAIRHPVPAGSPPSEPPAPPLPPLEESDPAVRNALREPFGEQAVDAFLAPERIIERTVATIDSLDRDPVPLSVRPLEPTQGQLEVRAEDNAFVLAPSNGQRYAAYMSALEAADAGRAAELYLRYYPLFQQAYEQMGNADRHFNDRLVEIIDHLLATPEVEHPIRLIRPEVVYEFADPELEQRSSGQKTLIRIGGENARIVKAKLREIRQVIASDRLGD